MAPALRKAVRTGLALADRVSWHLSRGLLPEGPGLITVALHSLCSTRSQVDDCALAPNQNVSVEDLSNLVDTMLESGYTAVSPAQVDTELDPGGKYVMLTFDDGYFNNVLALDVLEQYKIPATFFVSTNHVLAQKAFWWDALSRELVKAGATDAQRSAAFRKFKAMDSGRIDEYLHRNFGAEALRPLSDRDRPFTRGELTSFARHRWVHLGNHTSDHAILTGCSREEMRRQIQDCQEVLTAVAGYAPIAISYPNGNHSPAVVEAALAAGLRVGVTVRPRRNRLPLHGAAGRMNLGRFYFHGGGDPRDEFARWRAGFIPTHLIKALMNSA
jgi:peptidoglycan/xylan/chitin deacetylase (PgdA/CDA1 family)